MEFDDDFFECRIYSAFWEGEPPGEPKLSARCGVQLLKAKKFLGSARALPSRKTVANRHLLFVVHYSLSDIRYSPSFWVGRSLALSIHSVTRPSSHAPRPVESRRLGSASSTTG
jgi:hypothetical protein